MHPKYRRYFWQVFIYGVIWWIFALLYVIIEKGILGDTTIYPATNNTYDFKNALIYTPVGGFFIGVFQGLTEVLLMQKIFLNKSFWQKILFKGGFYLLMIILSLVLLTIGINAIRYNASPLDPAVINSLKAFYSDFAFWSIVIYGGVIADIALFFSEVRDYLGNNIFSNYSFGTYYKPKREVRIFMFLDMKSSTTIAEKLGHKKYFELIKHYYSDMTDALLETSGEIYQYVGDEIVVTWHESEGLDNNNCLNCFKKIKEAVQARKDYYEEYFGFIPQFKAGLHLGEVTAGEIGTLKKEIIYSGDVLNTAARIQALCNGYEASILISESLKRKLRDTSLWKIEEIGTISLRGRSAPMQLYQVNII